MNTSGPPTETPETTTAPSAVSRLGRGLLGLREFVTLCVVLLVVAYFHFKTHPAGAPFWESGFLSGRNMSVVLVSACNQGIVAVGMTIVIVAGGFDLSVGSVLALAGLVSAKLLKLDLPLVPALAAGLGVGCLAGLINGVIVTRAQVNPLIATLGMMTIARGLVLVDVSAHGATTNLPASFTALAAEWHGIPGAGVVFTMLILMLLGDLFLRNSRWLRQVYYIGGNERAARLSGINVEGVRTATFVICGTLAALAGIMNTARFNAATYEAGQGLELQVIAAVVIGGASLAGGQGTVFGAALGVFLMNCISIGLTLIRVAPAWQLVATGIVLIIAVSLDMFITRRRAAA